VRNVQHKVQGRRESAHLNWVWAGVLCVQVLWLADNYISSITGLSQLAGLWQLNLARNDITVVGNSLQQNTDLTSLNLADNRINSMRVRLWRLLHPEWCRKC
jgi:hypothetical protein